MIFTISSGFGGFLAAVGLIALFTGAYTAVTRRRSWARLPRSRGAGLAVIAAGFVVLLVGSATSGSTPPPAVAAATHSPSATPSPTPTPTPTPTADTSAEPVDPEVPTTYTAGPSVVIADSTVTAPPAIELLETLAIKGKAAKTGYDRSDGFGKAWLDVDGNGCDTRNDILKRDLADTTPSGSCKIMTGRLLDPYSGTELKFVRGNTTSTDVQIDHVVALLDAWQTGGQQLTPGQRISLANDPINLMTVSAASNRGKGAGNAATWLPKNNAVRCEYVARQISVKATYGLWVTQPEHDAMQNILAGCATQPSFTSTFAPAPPPPPAPAPEPAPVPEPEPAPEPAPPADPEPAPAPAPEPEAPSAYYQNCDAARAAGAAPVHAGDPGYGRHLDRDGDGVGCE